VRYKREESCRGDCTTGRRRGAGRTLSGALGGLAGRLSAVWVGALTALAAALIIGLIGVALGAHELVPPRRVVRVRDFGFGRRSSRWWVPSSPLGQEAGWRARLPACAVRNRPCSTVP
jgi:hypothetical protein